MSRSFLAYAKPMNGLYQKKWKSLEHFFNALLFLWQTKKLYATERHFESEKPYFSMPELYVCACQKHLVFAVNLHQIVCFRHWKRKVSIFIAMVETFFCRTVCRRFWLLLSALVCFFFSRAFIIEEGNKRAAVIMINTQI